MEVATTRRSSQLENHSTDIINPPAIYPGISAEVAGKNRAEFHANVQQTGSRTENDLSRPWRERNAIAWKNNQKNQ